VILLLLTLAHADPNAPLARQGERVRAGRWATVEGDGPATVRWRRRAGAVYASTFPDGTVERYRRTEDGAPTEAAWFSAAGLRLSAATYASGDPATFTAVVPPGPTVDLTNWAPVSAAGLRFPAPSPGSRWSLGSGDVVVTATPDTDPTAAAFAHELEVGCACEIVDRHAAWIDGRYGVRFAARLPDIPEPRWGEIWVVPGPSQTAVLFATWSPADPTPLSALRAIVSLASWESP